MPGNTAFGPCRTRATDGMLFGMSEMPGSPVWIENAGQCEDDERREVKRRRRSTGAGEPAAGSDPRCVMSHARPWRALG